MFGWSSLFALPKEIRVATCSSFVRSKIDGIHGEFLSRHAFFTLLSRKEAWSLIFSGVLASYLNERETERLIQDYSGGFEDAKMELEFICGIFSLPIKLEVKMFKPSTYGLFDPHQSDRDLQPSHCLADRQNAPVYIFGTYLPDLKLKCLKYIDSMLSNLNYAASVSTKHGSGFQRDVLEAVHVMSLKHKV